MSIPNALPALEPSVCSTGEHPLIWAEHSVGVNLFVGKLSGGFGGSGFGSVTG